MHRGNPQPAALHDFQAPSTARPASADAQHESPATTAGAIGDLFTEANEEELALLMFSIERGDAPAASRMARHILAVIAASAKPRPQVFNAERFDDAAPSEPTMPKGQLSPRELQVLRLISQGWSNRKIADTLHRSGNTIDTQIKSIYRKLAVNSRTQAVRRATQQGLLNWVANDADAQQ